MTILGITRDKEKVIKLKILNTDFNCKNNTLKPSFKHKIILDVGASNPRGSLKISAKTDDGKDIFTKSGVYVNDTSSGFESSEDFVNKISAVIKDTYDKVQEISKTEHFAPGEEKLSGVGIFVPGTVRGDKVAFMPNLKDKKGNSLENVDFSDYKKFLTDKFSFETGMDVNNKDFKFIVTKDLGGAGLGIAKILAKKDELHEGDYIMGIMTGGGFGSVDIKVKHGNVEIETSESSSYLTHDFINNKMEKLGRLGVSVKSHIERYMDTIGMSEMLPVVLKAGDARIVTDNEIHINTSNRKLICELLQDSRFKIKTKNAEETVIEIEDSSPRFAQKMKASRIEAVNNYAESVSLIAVNKIDDCLNKIVLVGPFAHGVNKHIKDNQEDFGAKDLPELIDQKIQKRIKDVDLPASAGLKKLYNFDIICDPSINFPNNTFAGDALLNKNLNFVDNRGSWMDIPIETLKSLN